MEAAAEVIHRLQRIGVALTKDALAHLYGLLQVGPGTLRLVAALVELTEVCEGNGGRWVGSQDTSLVLDGLLEEACGAPEVPVREQLDGDC